MKKSDSSKKLTLKRERIRTLTNEQSKEVAGGSVIIPKSHFDTQCCHGPVVQ